MTTHPMHPAGVAAGSASSAPLRHTLVHLVVPLVITAGMALAYLGAFDRPEPHGLRVDIVGKGPAVLVAAQTLEDKLDGKLDVRTVSSETEARDLLHRQEIAGAYVPDPKAPKLIVATAASDTSARAVEEVFAWVTAARHLPLAVEDVAPVPPDDRTGQGVFFLLVALSVGAYGAAAAIGTAGAALPAWLRAGLGVVAALAVSAIAVVVAGPIYGVLDGHAVRIWGLALLYATGVTLIGVGLHPCLKRWTTPTLMGLFVMLNFTSSGGIFAPALQPGFFGALHEFWTGAAFVEASRKVLYFGDLGIGRHVLTLALWALAGLLLVGASAVAERRRGAHRRPLPPREQVEEELEEVVAV